MHGIRNLPRVSGAYIVYPIFLLLHSLEFPVVHMFLSHYCSLCAHSAKLRSQSYGATAAAGTLQYTFCPEGAVLIVEVGKILRSLPG